MTLPETLRSVAHALQNAPTLESAKLQAATVLWVAEQLEWGAKRDYDYASIWGPTIQDTTESLVHKYPRGIPVRVSAERRPCWMWDCQILKWSRWLTGQGRDELWTHWLPDSDQKPELPPQ